MTKGHNRKFSQSIKDVAFVNIEPYALPIMGSGSKPHG